MNKNNLISFMKVSRFIFSSMMWDYPKNILDFCSERWLTVHWGLCIILCIIPKNSWGLRGVRLELYRRSGQEKDLQIFGPVSRISKLADQVQELIGLRFMAQLLFEIGREFIIFIPKLHERVEKR